jgi:hypothetical protein
MQELKIFGRLQTQIIYLLREIQPEHPPNLIQRTEHNSILFSAMYFKNQLWLSETKIRGFPQHFAEWNVL